MTRAKTKEPITPAERELLKRRLRRLTRGYYDIQKLRIQTGARLVSNFLAKVGIKPGEKIPDHIKDKLNRWSTLYKRLTDGIANPYKLPTQVLEEKTEGVISNVTELLLAETYLDLVKKENLYIKHIKEIISIFPIWDKFLKDVKGVGEAMAGVIISELDPYKAEYASSFWKYAGLDVTPDGKGRSKRSESLVEIEYIDKKGRKKTRKSITYNPFLKAKLLGVLGTNFLRSKSKYADIYRNYRNRLDNHPNHKDKIKLHKHRMALRYMIKMFLIDLYLAWRELEGLPVHPPYAEAKLGIVHHNSTSRSA